MEKKSRVQKFRKALFLCGMLLGLTACGNAAEEATIERIGPPWEELVFEKSAELEYAEKFSIEYAAEGYVRITIENEGQYLVVPEDQETPVNVPEGITILQRPIEHIYLAATSAMDSFCSLDRLDAIDFSSMQEDSWQIEKAKEAMEQGEIRYAGKYSAPDYEQIVENNCDLAIESTMIYHTPEVKENLESFGIPVLVDRSSYEPHPLGRTEWIKVYAALLGEDALAEEKMAEQSTYLKTVETAEKTGKKVGFFYVSSKGYVNVRKSGDYVSKMIELAGGEYLFADLGEEDSNLSTMNMQMEDFYVAAKEADILIYNSTIDGELTSLEALLEKCPLLTHCKAVQNGEVWCTTQNMFQETMHLGDMIEDFSAVIHLDTKNVRKLSYLYRLD